MSVQIIECEQGSPEWFEARRGIPTASEFAAILSKGRGKEPSKTRMTYMRKLAGEIVTGELQDKVTTFDMERGKNLEVEARTRYAFVKDVEPRQVGFVRNGNTGCSPDSLINDDGMLEIKTKNPHLMIEALLTEEFPEEFFAQCMGSLWVAEREWIDLNVYPSNPRLPVLEKRLVRDEAYIKTLADEVDRFNDELNAMVAKIEAYNT